MAQTPETEATPEQFALLDAALTRAVHTALTEPPTFGYISDDLVGLNAATTWHIPKRNAMLNVRLGTVGLKDTDSVSELALRESRPIQIELASQDGQVGTYTFEPSRYGQLATVTSTSESPVGTLLDHLDELGSPAGILPYLVYAVQNRARHVTTERAVSLRGRGRFFPTEVTLQEISSTKDNAYQHTITVARKGDTPENSFWFQHSSTGGRTQPTAAYREGSGQPPETADATRPHLTASQLRKIGEEGLWGIDYAVNNGVGNYQLSGSYSHGEVKFDGTSPGAHAGYYGAAGYLDARSPFPPSPDERLCALNLD